MLTGPYGRAVMVATSKFEGIGMTSLRTRQRLIDRLKEQGIKDLRVLDVILNTPRHLFVDEALAHKAYEDTALPISHQQTISQPYIVARMTELLLDVKPKSIYEIGTGSGYQAVILAQLFDEVVSVERIKPLLDKAKQRCRKLGITNIRFHFADGTSNEAVGLFDGILVAAAPAQVPDTLIERLAVGGRLVMPVGDSEHQELVVIDKHESGIETQVISSVKFVPLLPGTIK